jgi:hypothetical protein
MNDFGPPKKQVKIPNYKDIEGEMEDYEPIVEEPEEIEEVKNAVQLPVISSFGQINYTNNNGNDDQFYM